MEVLWHSIWALALLIGMAWAVQSASRYDSWEPSRSKGPPW